MIDKIVNGSYGPLAGYYFTDTIPLYINYLVWWMHALGNNYAALPAIMNYSNAFFSTLCVIPAYFIIKNIFNDNIAFCSVIALIFNPSFYQASTYGTPHLIAFFFFIMSVYLFIIWLDNNRWPKYVALALSCICLSLSMLIKTPLVLAGAILPTLLYIKKVKDTKRLLLSFVAPAIAFILFFTIRNQIIGSLDTDTASVGSLINWVKYFFGTFSFGFFIRQIKPPVLGLGVMTSILGLISLLYFLRKKRIDILLFIVSWAALSYFFWFFVHGNSTRHFMIGVLPVIVMVTAFIHEKAPRFTLILTIVLIAGNALTTQPSPSTYFTSGNLFKSTQLHNNRTTSYHARAIDIVSIEDKKVAVMGYYHNPYVIYEILRRSSSYEARLLTSVRSSVVHIKTDDREYMFCYVDKSDPQANIERTLALYDLSGYTIVSATYELEWLQKRGIKSINTNLLDPYHSNSLKNLLSFI